MTPQKMLESRTRWKNTLRATKTDPIVRAVAPSLAYWGRYTTESWKSWQKAIRQMIWKVPTGHGNHLHLEECT